MKIVHRPAWNGTFVSAALIAVTLTCNCIGLAAEPTKPTFAIAIHGGAGLEPAKLSPADRQNHEVALRRALLAGQKILASGGQALDAVEASIRILEDEPLYNAGKGAVFNSVGKHELDAAIVDGRERRAGGVAGVTTIKNPISLARLVMTQTPHVLLIGEGAESFADEMKSHSQIERVSNDYFSTPHRRSEWLEAKAREAAQPAAAKIPGKGTVGCVAFDQQGNLAAGTSTGGLTNKKWGRVGSVPIVGAGTFADNDTLAVSGTGIGEEFLRNSVGFHLHALMKYRELQLDKAVEQMVDQILPPDTGGIIAIDRVGKLTMRCNTPGMARAATDSSGQVTIQLER